MKRYYLLGLCAIFGMAASLASACDGGGDGADSDSGTDSDTDADSDTDTDTEATYPAVAPSLPRVLTGGGPIIAAPKIVPIFFAADELQGSIESFLDALAASSYWSDVTTEYGVGAPSIGESIVVSTPAPASTTDDELATWLVTQTDGAHEGWPQADADTIFTLFYPATTAISVHDKDSCSWWDGYHKEDTTTEAGTLVYAVLARCTPSLDDLTVATAHELVAAATDPYYYTDPAYSFTDDAHFAWTMATVGEVNDLCLFEPGVDAQLVGDFVVPRSWSNERADLGLDPCIPPVDGPYYGAQFASPEPVVMHVGSFSVATEGVHVGVGETKAIDIALYSDGPTDDIELQAFDESHYWGGTKQLDLALDPPSGKNGDVVHLTITALEAGSYGGSLVFLKSTLGATGHVWLGFVEN